MVSVRACRVFINPEAFAFTIIVMIHTLTVPFFMTLDSKMVVAFASKAAVSHARFQNSLRQGNACWNSILVHFFFGHGAKLVDVLFYFFSITQALFFFNQGSGFWDFCNFYRRGVRFFLLDDYLSRA